MVTIPQPTDLDAWHPARFVSITPKTNRFGQQCWFWTFRLGSSRLCNGITEVAVEPGTLAGQWLRAVLGREPIPGETIEDGGDLRALVRLERKGEHLNVVDVAEAMDF